MPTDIGYARADVSMLMFFRGSIEQSLAFTPRFSMSTMFFSSKVQCCVSSLILALSLVNGVRADWPSSTGSSVQLVGLIQDSADRLVPSITSIQCQAMSKAAISLAETYNITVDGQPIGWRVAQTDDEMITALGRTCCAVSTKNVIGIVGSGLSREIRFVSQAAQHLNASLMIRLLLFLMLLAQF